MAMPIMGPCPLKFWGIEKVSASPRAGDIIKIILCRDALWIHTLSGEPHGLKESLNLACFLIHNFEVLLLFKFGPLWLFLLLISPSMTGIAHLFFVSLPSQM